MNNRSAKASLESRQASSAATICFETALLHRNKRIVVGGGPPVLANLFGHAGDGRHQRIGVGEDLVLQPQRMELPHQIRQRRS